MNNKDLKSDSHVIPVSHFRSCLSEWGMPLGGRELLFPLLAPSSFSAVQTESTSLERSLWVLGGALANNVEIYPPAWRARGVNLGCLSVAYSQDPMNELREVFLDTTFVCIVLDGLRLKRRDYIFLSHRARQFKKSILLVQPYYLSPAIANVWARYRVNCIPSHLGLRLQMRRGGCPSYVEIRDVCGDANAI